MSRAFHVMTKPIGPICNLGCRYCFYLEKEKLFGANERFRMSGEVLEAYVRQYIEAQEGPEITFAWQGGEPTLMGVDFFRQIIELQRKYARGKRIANALQTNGTLLDDEWGAFLAEHQFLVGISIDGPPKLHDLYRKDKQDRGTYERVAHGLGILKKHGVAFNTLTVVNRANAKKPLDLYRFLKRLGAEYLQFIPLVERVASRPPVTEWSVEPRQYGEFLTAIFDEWVREDVGRIFVQIFDTALAKWMGLGGGLCLFDETCGQALAMEHNGDVYSCDHFVDPQWKLGNIREQPLGDLAASEKQVAFGNAKAATLPKYCRECEVRFACHGECPKNRFMRTPDGEPGLNYLCPAYKHFFTHVDPAMKQMATLLRQGLPAAWIMNAQPGYAASHFSKK
ncbi:MAG: anaerobic sulfatase maturase [Chthoniobacteraceae bacterium]